MLAFAHAGWVMYAAMIAGACGGFVTPSLQALMTRAVPTNAQGELQGAVASALAITVFSGPVIMTQLFAIFTRPGNFYFPGAPFLLSAIIFIFSAALFALVTRRNKVLTTPRDETSETA